VATLLYRRLFAADCDNSFYYLMSLTVNSQLYRLLWHEPIRQQQLSGDALRGTEYTKSGGVGAVTCSTQITGQVVIGGHCHQKD
jgi:hypothetical protein